MTKPTLQSWGRLAFPQALLAVLAACGGDSGSSPPPPPATYTVGGAVTGLVGSDLVLQNNGGDDLAVTVQGSITFATALADGAAYAVTVKVQPGSPRQICLVSNGSGTINAANVTNVTVACSHPSASLAYATNAGDNTISVYSINSRGGLIALGTPVSTGSSPYAIVGSLDGKHVYVGNETSNDISAYDVDAVTGALTSIAGSPFAAGTDPHALAFDSSGAYLYVANKGSDTLSAYAVNASTGALTPLATPTYATGRGPAAIAVYGSAKFVIVANNGGSNDISVFAITAATGELTPVAGSPFAAGGNPHSLAMVEKGNYNDKTFLYASNFDGTSYTISGFSVDSSTGALTALSGSPFALGISNNMLAAVVTYGSPILYVTTGSNLVGYDIDYSSGMLSAAAGFPLVAGTNAYSVTINEIRAPAVYVCNEGDASISGYEDDIFSGGLKELPGSPFPAGANPVFLAIL